MLSTTHWLLAPLNAARQALHRAAQRLHRGVVMTHGLVPIRPLSPRHRERVAQHLLRLNARDRYLRFGYPASDDQVRRYADMLDFARDEVVGVFNRRLELIAMAHVAFAPLGEYTSCAEFGVSVSASARGRGYGARLFARAVTLARNRGVSMMFIHALTENTAMLKIARNAGASVQREGSESEAHLQLPPAGLDTRMSKIVAEHFGEADYQLKKQAQQFWRFLQGMQEVRQGVRDARHQAAE